MSTFPVQCSVTGKVTQGAKNFGSFLYSSLNKAGAKIKETVKDNVSVFIALPFLCTLNMLIIHINLPFVQNILGEFSKEQEAFIKGQQGGVDNAIPPWIGHQNEQKVKEEILGLSSVR